MADQRGIEVLALPLGFSYVTFSHTGSRMSDGFPTPLALDGMGSFAGGRSHGGGHRHHDRSCGSCATARTATPSARSAACWGIARRRTTRTAYGGTTTLDLRRAPASRWSQDFVSLNGTTVNCAGGVVVPRAGTGSRARRRVVGPDASDPLVRFPKRHGYLFQTPVDRGPHELRMGVPIAAAGRFSHEAAAVDERTGSVYETEDPGSGVGAGFYRYTPKRPRRPDGRAARCDMLAIAGQPRVDLREGRTRGERLPVQWVPIDEPDPELTGIADTDSTFNEGWAKGGAKFNRLEGCWEDDGTIFFVSTSGGDVKNGDVNSDGYQEGFGQVWAYQPGRHGGGTLMLVYESPSGAELDSPDNLTVTPRGGLVACEDDASSAFVDTHPLAPGIENVNRLIGITLKGEASSCCQRPQRLRDGGRQLQPRAGGRCSSTSSVARASTSAGRGDDLRRHGAVASRPAVVGQGVSSPARSCVISARTSSGGWPSDSSTTSFA